jgi:DNA adenine methylase
MHVPPVSAYNQINDATHRLKNRASMDELLTEDSHMEPTTRKASQQSDTQAVALEPVSAAPGSEHLAVCQPSQMELQTAGALPISSIEAQPFLKWAGGKNQLLQQFEPFFPRAVTAYAEPFVGGGAVFFHLKARHPEMQACLGDSNLELINCYEVVRDHVETLMERLDEHLFHFKAELEPYFYSVRGQHQLDDPIARAARMIFLNKTCFNGLWRVNGRGQFNVPIGSYQPDKVSLYERGNLLAASRALTGVKLAVQDFRESLSATPPGTLAYVDPPYDPISATANFTSYTKEIFGKSHQTELARLFKSAAERGVKLMLSNSDTPFIRNLYEEFELRTVKARRALNADATKRGWISEILVLSGVA